MTSPRTPGHEPLDGDTVADVVVVGAGLTGLWTAYYLLDADAALDVLLVDQDPLAADDDRSAAAGVDAGVCTTELDADGARVAELFGPQVAAAARAAARDAVVEIGGVLALEEIECGFTFGGAVRIALGAAQAARLEAHARTARTWGDEWDVLGPDELADHVDVPGAALGAWTPDVAVLDPVSLAAGLRDVLRQRGARIAASTSAVRVSPRAVVTDRGTVRARQVVVATGAGRGFAVPGVRAEKVSTLVTAPLDAAAWAHAGLDRRTAVVGSGRRGVLARRAGDRLVVTADTDPRVAATRLFPALVAPAASSRDGSPADTVRSGTLGRTADGLPVVWLDDDGIAHAGGYGWAGHVMSNVAGRTLADLLTQTESALTRLPWVRPAAPARDRLAAVRAAVLRAASDRADAEEVVGGSPGPAAALLDRLR
ncbi:FAD-binding oxidoreductase [Cellulomonas sp. HZM]|uniref:NAD(P)/FAD-dependent oxidoreductase n=1 Tax=Cellulomonas sp. HZM TaxID=1454010 RepID=UPI00068929F5|nr:FAD-dependent oxidoreductase [Cellulomonas sp. HZM]